jgi:GH25 family lysozyme M1 (1,4-beta-N-acetylmuramidase)
MTDLIKGCDVSVDQGIINWQALATANWKFCICRAGVGNDSIDHNLSQNLQGAKNVGLHTGVYNFIYPLPTTTAQPLRDPVKQAQYHFQSAPGQLAFTDSEWPLPSDWKNWSCSASQITDWVSAYQLEYKKLNGSFPIIYTYPDFAQELKLPASFGTDYQLWIASYETSPTIPSPWNDWVMWQCSGGTDVLPGTGVKVDIDFVKDLSLWVPVPIAPTVAPISVLTVSTPPPVVAPTPPVSSVSTPVSAPAKPNLLALIWQLLVGILKTEKMV